MLVYVRYCNILYGKKLQWRRCLRRELILATKGMTAAAMDGLSGEESGCAWCNQLEEKRGLTGCNGHLRRRRALLPFRPQLDIYDGDLSLTLQPNSSEDLFVCVCVCVCCACVCEMRKVAPAALTHSLTFCYMASDGAAKLLWKFEM